MPGRQKGETFRILMATLLAPLGSSRGGQQATVAFLRPCLLLCSVVCSAVVVCLYFELTNRVGPPSSGALSTSLKYLPPFFWLQLGFLTLPAAVAIARPSLGGRAMTIYLVGSTVALLAMSNGFRMPLTLAA